MMEAFFILTFLCGVLAGCTLALVIWARQDRYEIPTRCVDCEPRGGEGQ